MEAIEEPPVVNSVTESVKSNISNDESKIAEVSVEINVCHKSNGDAEANNMEQDQAVVPETQNSTVDEITTTPVADEVHEENVIDECDKALPTEQTAEATVTGEQKIPEAEDEKEPMESEKNDNQEKIVIEETCIVIDGIVDTAAENVTFETEILIEQNVSELENDSNKEETSNNLLLSELGQNIELSDVLRSSDITENVENNNCKQEVFNKEELLDILEGNDTEQNQSRKVISEKFLEESKKLEAQLALQQLSRLKCKKRGGSKQKIGKKANTSPKMFKEMKSHNVSKVVNISNVAVKKKVTQNIGKEIKSDETTEENVDNTTGQKSSSSMSQEINSAEVSHEESIVNALVKDWEDDEHTDNDQSKKLLEEGENLLTSTEEVVKVEESISKLDDSTANGADGQTLNMNKSDDNLPQRRLGRVIKKKVIFDPDNPDTFTKTKSNIIKKESTAEKDQSMSLKKSKIEQIPIRSKSKSPVNKLQWKKPPPKNSKQYKRLTEIDKLLMDEGAVNMICQLTPEAPKGKKNMKSKAEFIKKIQSTTPDTKEMKFRERKKECKIDDNEAKKIIGGKSRLSLSSSIKSPSACDDFEAHSADDSIIYRRHSSSSYSSSCMSPRRLSDVEGNVNAATSLLQNVHPDSKNISVIIESDDNPSEVFRSDTSISQAGEIINKHDCLSIKEKLNTKLSQALNKRKRENTKTDKPSKLKKVTKSESVGASGDDSRNITVSYADRVAEIYVRRTGPFYNPQVLHDLETVITEINSKNNTTVTLILFENGALCSGLNLSPMLKEDIGDKYAMQISSAARSLLCTLERHSKFLCIGIEGKCEGFSVAAAALCDMLLASDNVTFSLTESNGLLLQPGTIALTSRNLCQNMINNLVVSGKQISASEALNGGLVSRTIWPQRFAEQVRAIARDIAAQPCDNVMLKKHLLALKRKESEATFVLSVEREQELLVKYWTSGPGRESLRAALSAARSAAPPDAAERV